MDLLKRIDRRWRAFRHSEAVASENYYAAEQDQRPPQLFPAVTEVSAAQAVGEEITAQDFRGPSLYSDIHGRSVSRNASPDYGIRSSTGAVQVTALAGYEFLDSATVSDSSRVSTPLRVQGFDEIELDPKPATGKSRLTAATAPSPSSHPAATAPKQASRRSLAQLLIAAAEAAAWSTGQHLLAARSTLSHLLRKASAGHLPTAASPVAAAEAVGPARKSTWQRHPCTAVGCLLLLLVLTAAVVGVAIGVTAGVKGQFPWWARGSGARNEPELWVPSGDSQLDSLMQLKAAVDSNNLLTDWKPHEAANGGYCSWDFVTCDKSQTIVEGINLTTNSFMFVLQGQLPSGEALAGLTGLKSLDIREHHISGPLPEDWYQLPLQVIKLDQNKLDGELPAAWLTESPLSSSLRVLTLWDNKLSGPLPGTTGGMQNLQELDLSFNGFEGQLPSSWSSMTSLRQLWVDVNRLSGSLPASWSDMRALEKLVLSENSLTGALPSSWSAMKTLKELWLEYNQLTGQLPDAYSSLSQLQTLVLNNNNLSHSVPKTWAELKQLQAVYLYNNQELTGCVPKSWKAQFAEDFDADYFLLEGTGLTGPQSNVPPGRPSGAPMKPEQPRPPQPPNKGPRPSTPVKPKPPPAMDPRPAPSPPGQATPAKANAEGQLASLLAVKAAMDQKGVLDDVWTVQSGVNGGFCEWLYVTCDVDGVVRAVNLTTNAYESTLTGTLPSGAQAFAGLPGLQVVDVRMHRIGGTLPGDWAAYMPSIEVIKLDGNELTGWLPSSWSSLATLEEITLYSNQLMGSMPASWGALQHMQHLDLSFNSLEGSLPASWSAWTNARIMHLESNKLSGSLPVSWGVLSSLQKAVLSENGLSGPLPEAWSGMKSLRELWVEFNQLSGALPASFGDLGSSLQLLMLNDNNFTGDIPASWGRLQKVTNVYLYNNPTLGGCLPAALRGQLRYDIDMYVKQNTRVSGFC